MSRWDGWDRWGWYAPAPKRPPPKHGIRVKKTGSTWWGQRWVEALELMSRGYSNRLARGRTYARAGRTHDLEVEAGEVTARVTGSRATPYKVRIKLVKLPDAVWRKAVAAMASEARFTAELLAGQMPQEIDAAFQQAGASLFPAKEAHLETDCSCPDWANPCKHVAATHYVLGEALDRDPFLLFELRGRTKEQVLDALRAARADDGHTEPPSPGKKRRKGRRTEAREAEVPRVPLARLAAADYDKPREPIPALHLSFETPPISGAVLRQLGSPAAWSSETSPAEMLAPLLRAAAQEARRLALAEPEVAQQSEPVEEPRAWATARRKGTPNRAASKKPTARKETAAEKLSTATTTATASKKGSRPTTGAVKAKRAGKTTARAAKTRSANPTPHSKARRKKS